MNLITNILEKKILSFTLIFFTFISCIGLFNPSWYSLILYQLSLNLYYLLLAIISNLLYYLSVSSPSGDIKNKNLQPSPLYYK